MLAIRGISDIVGLKHGSMSTQRHHTGQRK